MFSFIGTATVFLFADVAVAFRLAMRARYFWLFFSSLLGMAVCVFLSSFFSGRQPATVGLDFGISIIRIVLPIVLIVVSQELVFRELDQRFFLRTLTYPYPRYRFLLGRFVAILLLVGGLLVAMASVLSLLVVWIGQGYPQSTPVSLDYRFWLVIGFVGLDAFVLTALACLLSVTASTPSFVLLGTLGFMLVSRSFFSVIELLTRDAGVVSDSESYLVGIGMLRYVLPDLGALDVRMIALYGELDFLPADWAWLVLSCVIYSLVLLMLAVRALNHKSFS